MKSAMMEIEVVQLTRDECKRLKERAKTLAPALTWGTFGPNQNEQVQRKLLIELETDHLENILITQVHIPPVYRAIILEILKDRYIFGL